MEHAAQQGEHEADANLMTFGEGDMEAMETVLNQLMEDGDGAVDAGSAEGTLAAELGSAFDMPEGDALERDGFQEGEGEGDGDEGEGEGEAQNGDEERVDLEQEQEPDQDQADEDELSRFGGEENEDVEQDEQSLAPLEDEEDQDQVNREGVAGGEEDMELIKPDDEDDAEEGSKSGKENDDESRLESEESSRAAEEGGGDGESTQQPQEEGEEGGEAREGDAEEVEEDSGNTEPKEEVPKVRQWTKKWVSVGHLKVYKWVPLDGKLPKKPARPILMPQNVSAKDQKALARTQRLLNDNAPITRSVTAAFKEKHQREMEKRSKRQKVSESPSPASRATRSSSRLRIKESKEIFSKISEDNIITPQRLSQELHTGGRGGRKRKARSGEDDVAAEPDGNSNTGLEPIDAAPGGAGTGLITNDVPLELPVPVSLSSDTAGAKERRLY